MYEDEIIITNNLVSRYYRPPEIFLGCSYDTKVDMWSFGCTIYELYTGKILFPGKDNNEMLKLIMQVKGKPNTKFIKRGKFSSLFFSESSNFDFLSIEQDPISRKDYIKEVNVSLNPVKDLFSLLKSANNNPNDKALPVFKDFLDKCLMVDPNKRMSAVDALCHPFIDINPRF